MARIGINTGSAANDNTGSTLRAAGGIINDNFSEIYTHFGNGTNLTSIGGTWTSTSVGIHTLKNVGIGTTNPTSALTVTGNGTFTGVVTATTFIGALTGTASTATLSTNAQGLTGTPNITVGVVTASRLNVGTSGTVITTTDSGLVGIGTTNPRFALEVGAVGASGTTLFVNGDARVTGIVTIGPASITLNGITNIINVGTGITINGSTGIISATAIVLGGTTLTGSAVTSITAGSGISVNQSTGNVTITATGTGSTSQWVTTAAGIHTLSNVGIGTTNPTSALTVTGNGTFTGVVTATTFVGALTGTATTATNAQGLTGTPNITVGVATVSTLNVGTGGTVITTTTAGLVGIGTTNPTSKLTVSGDVLVSGKIVAGLTSSIIPFYWENFSDLPSFSTYHGAFAHVHQTGKAYYAHTRWVELVNKQADGTVGTGTENFNVGLVTATTLNVGTSGTIITTTTAGLVGIGTTNPTSVLTVKGNTSLETLSVSGISTLGTVQISSGIVTATSGIVTYYGDTSNAADGRWTLGASGNNDYTFTGIGFTQTTSDPVLYLARGRVYEFVNNSGGSHPFQIRVSNGGSAYSDGVTNNGGASGIIRFEIPFNAPNTLYYQCTSHSGMGNTMSVYPSTI